MMRRLLPILILLSACATGPDARLDAPATPAVSHRVDQDQSLLTIVVRRAGPLARLGHDHVIAVRGLDGRYDAQQQQASFRFRLDAMTVDEPALRQAAGLDTVPSPEAIAATRVNMLEKVLDAARYPEVRIDARRADGGLALAITLHGVTRTVVVPAQITEDAASISARGSFTLLQSEFGLTPMTVLGGALRVEDRMELAFRVRLARDQQAHAQAHEHGAGDPVQPERGTR
ncbi:YceI family protein [Massilia sp. TS11]|uniref:YceI family protein n=1 Tax=Massilia sp. TS11 TaxID=2908003 RepID=UPI001EDADB2C|nr:YceI family protein [Massilia sp. TS11]MCG2584010.1 YceI family protein [Massilia sp. TS11]